MALTRLFFPAAILLQIPVKLASFVRSQSEVVMKQVFSIKIIVESLFFFFCMNFLQVAA
jgi:hypothetical protein